MRSIIAFYEYRRRGIAMAAGEVYPLYSISADPFADIATWGIGCLHLRLPGQERIYRDISERKHHLELGLYEDILYLIIPLEFAGGLGKILQDLHFLRIYSTIRRYLERRFRCE